MLEYEPQECTGKCYTKLIQIRIVWGEKPKLHTSHHPIPQFSEYLSLPSSQIWVCERAALIIKQSDS